MYLFVIRGVLTCLSVIPVFLFEEPWGIAAAIFLFGAAQGLFGVPQITRVSELARRARQPEATAIALTRLMERVAASLGPLLATLLMAFVSREMAMLTIGALCAFCGVVLFFSLPRESDAASSLP